MRTLNRVVFIALMAGADEIAAGTGTPIPAVPDNFDTQSVDFHYVRSPKAGLGKRKPASQPSSDELIAEPQPAHKTAVVKFMRTVIVVTLISIGVVLIWRGFNGDFIRKSRPIRQR